MIPNKVERPRYVEGHGFGYATSLHAAATFVGSLEKGQT